MDRVIDELLLAYGPDFSPPLTASGDGNAPAAGLVVDETTPVPARSSEASGFVGPPFAGIAAPAHDPHAATARSYERAANRRRAVERARSRRQADDAQSTRPAPMSAALECNDDDIATLVQLEPHPSDNGDQPLFGEELPIETGWNAFEEATGETPTGLDRRAEALLDGRRRPLRRRKARRQS